MLLLSNYQLDDNHYCHEMKPSLSSVSFSSVVPNSLYHNNLLPLIRADPVSYSYWEQHLSILVPSTTAYPVSLHTPVHIVPFIYMNEAGSPR